MCLCRTCFFSSEHVLGLHSPLASICHPDGVALILTDFLPARYTASLLTHMTLILLTRPWCWLTWPDSCSHDPDSGWQDSAWFWVTWSWIWLQFSALLSYRMIFKSWLFFCFRRIPVSILGQPIWDSLKWSSYNMDSNFMLFLDEHPYCCSDLGPQLAPDGHQLSIVMLLVRPFPDALRSFSFDFQT